MGCVIVLHIALCRAIANFSVTFSIISVLTGLTTTYSTGLTYGGPLTMVYGWPIVGMLTLIVGLSMAEICSAFPTSGGLYFWSAKLCGSEWGPFASWITGWYASFPLPFILYFTRANTVIVNATKFSCHLPLKILLTFLF